MNIPDVDNYKSKWASHYKLIHPPVPDEIHNGKKHDLPQSGQDLTQACCIRSLSDSNPLGGYSEDENIVINT